MTGGLQADCPIVWHAAAAQAKHSSNDIWLVGMRGQVHQQSSYAPLQPLRKADQAAAPSTDEGGNGASASSNTCALVADDARHVARGAMAGKRGDLVAEHHEGQHQNHNDRDDNRGDNGAETAGDASNHVAGTLCDAGSDDGYLLLQRMMQSDK
ncbi:hypothetical protein SYNPS1DRAFT_31210 [Syncephalis pseudoplumigaleata]|uniref:Uncharacterized protein n=1 Tax=Syncephalis pseudoplumigaleata TaxID=1712513 RepID=A0A4P9YVY4_9FUNG|nr:hypothetical protein SYNPS1DRAFT_31210 [Syncephalis pseudoplumigaleata]|eukprot:RKP23090.1 hypothetical protein SYNPS1DRAFT_31210 [Syncephalis pseudoplumigaleata]